MTTSADGTDGVRHAAETLRAARDELPAAADQVDATISDRIRDVSDAVERATKGIPADLRGELLATAHDVRLHGTRMTAAREDAFAAASHVLAEYAGEIEALLRAADDGAESPALSVTPP
ncbi:hypothetical protein, partial [Jiangella anatolica]